MRVPCIDLQRQNKKYWNEYIEAIEIVLRKGNFIGGGELREFEKKFANFCQKKFCVGLNSGTDALKLALLAYGIKPGDEVITVPNSFFSSSTVISQVKANPVFVDINPNSHTMDVSQVADAITSKTRFIIPVHLYGQSSHMDPIIEVAIKHNLIVIEDACQAHGAKYKGKKVPISETGAFSFYPIKNLGCFGDGGAVVTDNVEIAEKLLYLRDLGSKKKYIHKLHGFNSRLDSLQAAVLKVKLQYLSKWNKTRRRVASIYNKRLDNIPEIKLPHEMDYAYHVYHLYVIEAQMRNKLQKYLTGCGVDTLIHYPTPIHLQEAYKDLGYKKGSFPVSEQKSKRILSLPMFPEITKEEIEYVVKKIGEFYAAI